MPSNPHNIGRVLIIAGSDSGGGAGIQGDLKAVTALGGYGMTAITALTAQNTQGVFGVHPVPEDFIAQQIDLCLEDIGADAIKTGMLHSAAVIETIADSLPDTIPLVVDPVMVAKGGSPLLEQQALSALKERLIPRATILTPNLPEAELLLGRPMGITHEEMIDAVNELLLLGCHSVLLKGGHADLDVLTDVFAERHKPAILLHTKRIDTQHTHGTGCTFASAIATGLAQKLPLEEAVRRGHAYVQAAIRNAPGLGYGHGPLGWPQLNLANPAFPG
jgi:hydroxymethylpyrimidine/phosphomethylpyrimidine kinase